LQHFDLSNVALGSLSTDSAQPRDVGYLLGSDILTAGVYAYMA
jgi:hypothetical protein